jgi:uncharacterized membrane protein YbaN (DUF454 family)
LTRIIYIIVGTLSLILGIAGIFVPGLPTTPFLLLAAGLYLKSSRKLYYLMLRNNTIRRYLSSFSKGVSVKTRLISILFMWTMIILSLHLFVHILLWQIVIVVAGMTGTVVMLLLKRGSKVRKFESSKV